MWTLLSTIGVPLLKWIFELIAKKKLTDKEFVDAVTSFQAKKARVGQASIDSDNAIAKAQAELKAEREQNNIEE